MQLYCKLTYQVKGHDYPVYSYFCDGGSLGKSYYSYNYLTPVPWKQANHYASDRLPLSLLPGRTSEPSDSFSNSSSPHVIKPLASICRALTGGVSIL
jgi:hypothetical protein